MAQAAGTLRTDLDRDDIGRFLGVIVDGIVAQRAFGFDPPEDVLVLRLTRDADRPSTRATSELARVGVGVDALRRRPRARRSRASRGTGSRRPRAASVDVPLTRVVGGERGADVVVAVDQLPQIPRAVAHVELRVEQVVDDEAVAAGAHGDALRRCPGGAASARSRPRPSARRVEPALGVDHRGEQRRLEVVVSARARRRSPRSAVDTGRAGTSPAPRSRPRRRRRPQPPTASATAITRRLTCGRRLRLELPHHAADPCVQVLEACPC